ASPFGRKVQRGAGSGSRRKNRVPGNVIDVTIDAIAGSIVEVPARVSVHIAVGRSGVRVSRGHNSLNLERPRPDKISLRCKSEDQRLWPGVYDDESMAILEINRVILLIGREKRAVYKHAAVNEIEPPFPGAFEDSRH